MLVQAVIEVTQIHTQTRVSIVITAFDEPLIRTTAFLECLFIPACHKQSRDQTEPRPSDFVKLARLFQKDDDFHVMQNGLLVPLIRIEYICHHSVRFGTESSRIQM